MYILWGPWNINNWLGTHPVWGRPLLTNIYNALVQCNLPLYRVWQKCVKETDFRFTRYSKNVLHQPLAIKCIVYRLLFETNVTKVISKNVLKLIICNSTLIIRTPSHCHRFLHLLSRFLGKKIKKGLLGRDSNTRPSS